MKLGIHHYPLVATRGFHHDQRELQLLKPLYPYIRAKVRADKDWNRKARQVRQEKRFFFVGFALSPALSL